MQCMRRTEDRADDHQPYHNMWPSPPCEAKPLLQIEVIVCLGTPRNAANSPIRQTRPAPETKPISKNAGRILWRGREKRGTINVLAFCHLHIAVTSNYPCVGYARGV